MPDLAKLSLGAVLLAKTGKSPATIARELKAKVQTVYSWLAGDRLPGPVWRAKLEARYKIPASAWDHPAVDPPKPSRSALVAKFERSQPHMPEPPPAVEDLDAPRDVRGVAERLLRHIDAELRRVDADKTMFAPEARTKIFRELSATLAKAAKFTGDAADISEAKILRSPAWERIRLAVWKALEPHPEAMKAVAEALAQCR